MYLYPTSSAWRLQELGKLIKATLICALAEKGSSTYSFGREHTVPFALEIQC